MIVLSFQPIALIPRQTRSAAIEVMNEDFVRTARAKGVPETVIALRRILRPRPDAGGRADRAHHDRGGHGAIFAEPVFGRPGLGRLTVEALINAGYRQSRR